MIEKSLVVYASIVFYFLAFAGMGWYTSYVKENAKRLFAAEIIILSVSLYLNLMVSIYSATGDTQDFVDMMKGLLEKGFFGLYSKGGVHYPPFFQYLYWAIAHIMQTLGIPLQADLRIFIFGVKLPCIICEFLAAGLIFKLAQKYAAKGREVLVLFLCLFNPGVFFTTVLICQVDILYVSFVVLTVYLLVEGRLKTAYFAFAAAVLFKFQAVFITPVIAYAVINHVFLNGFEKKRFFRHLAAGLAAIGMMLASYIPFIYNFKTGEVVSGSFVDNFSHTTAGFGYATQNARNFWSLIGYGDALQTERFGFMSCQAWGRLFIVLVVVLSFCIFWKRKRDVSMYPMIAAVLVYGTWCFSVRMMGRYMYAAVFLLFLGYACRPEKKRLYCAVLVSGAYMLQICSSMLLYPWAKIYRKGVIMPRIHAAVMLICFGYLVYVIWSEKSDDRFEMVSGEKSAGDGTYRL